MKECVLCIVFIFTILLIKGQTEFAPIGARWIQNEIINTQGNPSFDPLANYFIIESSKDTIITDKIYKKVGEYLVYQETDKIYYLWDDSLRLLYDFDVQIGDTVTYELLGCCPVMGVSAHSFIVKDVSQILVNQQILKKVNCVSISQCDLPDYEYIEKIGSTTRVVQNAVGCVTTPNIVLDWLRCYSDNDISYKSETFLSFNEPDCTIKGALNNIAEQIKLDLIISPNPVLNSIKLSAIPNIPINIDVSLYDARGIEYLKTEINPMVENDIYVEFLNPGMYFIVIENELVHLYARKFIKI